MGRDGDGLHPPGVLLAVSICLCQDDAQGDPLAGTDIFDSHIQLDNAAQRLHIGVPQVCCQGFLAALHCNVHRRRARLRIDDNAAVYFYRRSGESDCVPLCILVDDGLIYQFRPLSWRCVPESAYFVESVKMKKPLP